MNKLFACSILLALSSASVTAMACSKPDSSDSESDRKTKLEACKESLKSKSEEKKTSSNSDSKSKLSEKKDELSQKLESKRPESSKSSK